jgi:DnaJ-class molecular chaperone
MTQPVFKRCSNCFGTGTVFRKQSPSLKPSGIKCPVCKGATKIEVKGPK